MYCNITFAQIQEKVDFFIKSISIQFDEKSVLKNDENYSDVIPISSTMTKEKLEFLGINPLDADPKVKTFVKIVENEYLESTEDYNVTLQVGQYAIVEFRISKIANIAENSIVEFISLAKPIDFQLDESSQKVRSTLAHQNFGLKGENTLIGIIDSGIDYKNPDFKNNSGTENRIFSIWDMLATQGPPPTGFSAGTEWNHNQIQNQTCTHSDPEGHGTLVAGIAAGNGNSTGNSIPANTYVGMAPVANLLVANTTKNTASVVEALKWISDKAIAENKPWVANLSLGTKWGPRDGTSPFERCIDDILESPVFGSGRIAIVSAGNEGKSKRHITGSGTNTQTRVFNINSTTFSTNEHIYLEIWYPQFDNYSIKITTPNNNSYGPYSIGYGTTTNAGYGWVTNEGFIFVNNARYSNEYPNYYRDTDDNLIFIHLSDILHNNTQYHLENGNWTIELTGQNSYGRWDGYLIEGGVSSIFSEGHYDNSRTLTEPGTCYNVITVGSFNSKNYWLDVYGNPQSQSSYIINQISDFSSQGPTRDGRNKPEILAPGAWVASTKSSTYNGSPQNTARDGKHYHSIGTSLAAPHVTGTVALLFQQNPSYTLNQIKEILDESKTPEGYLDVYQAILLHYQDPLLPIRKNPLARSLNKQFYFYDFEPEILFSAKRNKIN